MSEQLEEDRVLYLELEAEHEKLELACGETRIRTEQGLALVGLAWSLRLLIERHEVTRCACLCGRPSEDKCASERSAWCDGCIDPC